MKNSESNLTFSENSFNLFSNRVVFCTLYSHGINYYYYYYYYFSILRLSIHSNLLVLHEVRASQTFEIGLNFE